MKTSTNINKKIVIDLSQPLAARSVLAKPNDPNNLNNLIQQPALEKIKSLIKAQLNDGKKKAQDERCSHGLSGIHFDRRHSAITIAGGRGSGKTTFMLSLADLLNERSTPPDEDWSGIVWLNLIDPTLLESKENILITILSELVCRVEKQYRQDRNGNNLEQDCNNLEQDYKEWYDSLTSLAKGITVLDKVGGAVAADAAWEDAQYVLEQGLSRAKSGMNLERCLHNCIEKALVFLKKKAFLLIFDDIDTRLDTGWDVLEVIRKYLTSPQLIVVVLGDLRLYSLLVLRQHYLMLGSKIIPENELKHIGMHEAMDHLQSQYINKILKMPNRIELKTLGTLLETHSIYIIPRCLNSTQSTNKTKSITLEIMIDNLCKNIFLKEKADITAIRRLILRQPVRNVLHLLSAIPYKVDQQGTTFKFEPDDDDKDKYLINIHNAIIQWCMNALYAHGICTDELQEATPTDILNKVVKFLDESALWIDGYRLKPEFRDDQHNLALLALGTRFAQLVKESPALLGHYFIWIGLTREAAKMNDHKTFQDFVGITTIRSLRNSACRAIGYMRSSGDSMTDGVGTKLGSIALSKSTPTAPPTPPATPIQLNSMSPFRSRLAGLPALLLIDATGNLTCYLSIYPMIAIISDLLSRSNSDISDLSDLLSKPDLNIDDFQDNSNTKIAEFLKDTKLDVENNLSRWGEIRNFPLYCEQDKLGKPILHQKITSAVRGTNFPLQSIKVQTLPTNVNADAEFFSEEVNIWAICANIEWPKDGNSLPAYVLGDIWSRFYHTIEYVDEKNSGSVPWKPGNLLNQYIVGFLNAVLLEEHRARKYPETSFGYANEDNYFLNNLKNTNYSTHPEKYPWFDLFFSFPLWALYLDKETYAKQIRHWKTLNKVPADEAIIKKREKFIEAEPLFDAYNKL